MKFFDKGEIEKFSSVRLLIKHLRNLSILSDSIVVVTSQDSESLFCMFGNMDYKLLLDIYGDSPYYSCHHSSVLSYSLYPIDFFEIYLFKQS